ncbi:MAG: hypothetical protein ACRD2D_00090, partial [Terriglobales bacterium]
MDFTVSVAEPFPPAIVVGLMLAELPFAEKETDRLTVELKLPLGAMVTVSLLEEFSATDSAEPALIPKSPADAEVT